MEDGPPLADCTHYVEVLQGDPAVCTGTLGPSEKTRRLLDTYLRVPILEREKAGLEADLAIERLANKNLAEEASVREWWERPSFWLPVVAVGVLGGILLGAAIDF